MIKAEIQSEISQAMQNELVDVTYTFTGSGKRGETTYNPITETWDGASTTYEGQLIGGLSFKKEDEQYFNIEVGDQKAIVLNGTPQIDDVITFALGTWRVKNLKLFPAEIGLVMQLRRYG